jgi:hypothetical protein
MVVLFYRIFIDKVVFFALISMVLGYVTTCGCSSVVERNLAKVDVARSNRVTRYYSVEGLQNSTSL